MAKNSPVNLDRVLAIIKRDGAGGELTLAEAAALIASRVKDTQETTRTARNRIRMQMCRSQALAGCDVTQGGLDCLSNGKYTVDEIGRWANRRHPGQFKDLPCSKRAWPVEVTEGLVLGGSAQAEFMPGTVEGAREEIRRLREDKQEMQDEATRVEAERKQKLVANFKRK